MNLIPTVPWLLFAIAAVALGLFARRTGRAWFPWALIGGMSSLLMTTIILGLADALFIPVSHEGYLRFCITMLVVVALMNALLLWLLTIGIHRQHLVVAELGRSFLCKALGTRGSRPNGYSVLTREFPLSSQETKQACKAAANRCKTT